MNLIFDIDGTLWDTTDVVAGAWMRAIKDSGVESIKDVCVTGAVLKREFGKPMDIIANDLFGEIDPDDKAHVLKFCCKYEHDAIADCNDDLAYENMRETLHELARKHNLYIVSNCQDGYIELVMEKNNITDIVKDYECFGHSGLYKAENIKLLMSRNNIEAKDTLYIGDTIGDFEATKEVGLKFVWAGYGFGTVDNPDYTIDKPSDLIRCMDRNSQELV